MTFVEWLTPVGESMSKENHDNSNDNHFDPCHSDGIIGGCSSCSHRDECIPPVTDDEFVRDPAEPRPDDEVLLVTTGEQLTLFDVNEYLNSDEDDFGGDEDVSKCFVHLEHDGIISRVSLTEYFDGFEDFIRLAVIQNIVSNVEVLIPTDEPAHVGFIHGTLYVGTAEQLSALSDAAGIVDSVDLSIEDLGDEW